MPPAEHQPSRGLLEADIDPDPLVQFRAWFEDGFHLDLAEPHACVLATASAQGWPSTRVVLLKGVDATGFLFFTNYRSRKGRDLAENPRASLCFHWQALRRQVRIAGTVEQAPERVSDAYFQGRPRGSQLGAWASPQSETVPGRQWLDDRMREVERRFANQPVPRPPHWGGYLLVPREIEFWLHGGDRLHDRLVYVKTDGGWRLERRAP